MVGQARFRDVNTRLRRRMDEVGTLIVVHRGTAVGSVAENTPAAVAAAVASGGDVVEIDVVRSTDGEFFAFHDGEEPRLLGTEADLRTLTAAEIRVQRHVHVDRPGRPSRVAGLRGLLTGMPPGTLVNLDRSWDWWEALLPELDRLGMAGQLLLKCRAEDGDRVAVLRDHGVKYPFLPICTTVDQAFAHLDDPDLNTVGVELLTRDPAGPFLQDGVVAELHARGVLVLVNAEVLSTGVDLFAGYDDERSVLGDPGEGWGPLFDLGVDAIQTDWPWLLRDYRSSRRRAMVEA
ncbi:glycerophosphodiester phosphodiesterase family protein [Citricoccus sp. SGAir0253]|uniref:glycerophosphodiester phosphodiesterase family protein n=1 Tax=Citricoccus sp. SGAir0253 TaxID=2567881 RepID=UPI0010CD1448|nr:glycerophosphodiester phosphodiesterase family protein [Citricoccus sp. SGAir0253]QCU77012.1 glycerophosphodiester phosphodiesterase family protein [Citricoccus sp. SGAir0253]